MALRSISAAIGASSVSAKCRTELRISLCFMQGLNSNLMLPTKEMFCAQIS